MAVVTENVVTISCDNPDCPGNELDPTERTGWIFASTEIYGQAATEQKVYCSSDCAAHISVALAQEIELIPGPPIDAGQPIPE